MAVLESHYSKEEFARWGQTIRDIRPHLTAGDEGKLVAIDIEMLLDTGFNGSLTLPLSENLAFVEGRNEEGWVAGDIRFRIEFP